MSTRRLTLIAFAVCCLFSVASHAKRVGYHARAAVVYGTVTTAQLDVRTPIGIKGRAFVLLPREGGGWTRKELVRYIKPDNGFVLTLATEGPNKQADVSQMRSRGVKFGIQKPSGSVMWLQRKGETHRPEMLGFPERHTQ